MIRIAAVGDLHAGLDSAGSIRTRFDDVGEHADVLLLAGDLTKLGTAEEAKVLAEEIRDVPVPVVTVLGNHDHHSGQQGDIRRVLEDADVTVLEGESTVVDIGEARVGVAGTKGFGGGFPGASASSFGEAEMKAFVDHSEDLAASLERSLEEVAGAGVRVALMHYAPIETTLSGERLEIYPFLGSYFLGEAVDRAGADLVLHGHAHRGTEKGVTPGGVHVRNVAETVIGAPYAVYRLSDGLHQEG